MKFFTTLSLLFSFSIALAQFTTPGTGVDWTLDDVATASPATVSVNGNVYTLSANLTVAATDILRINSDITLEIAAGVRVTVLEFGSFFISADQVLVTAVNEAAPYDGFRFEEGSDINIQNTTFQFGGGIQVLTETFTLNNCILQNNVSGVATGATVTLSRGMPVITNNQFLFNANPAISSGVTNQVSAIISGNYIEGNNQTNNNRPQINMSITRPSDTLKIIGNTVIGDRDMTMVGGISVANFVGGPVFAIIEDNVIIDNRYGIAVLWNNDYVEIKNNVIEDNNTQNLPMDGGSGINFLSTSGGQNVFLSENQIRRNLWGVTIIQQNPGASNINLGDDENNGGGNVFSENANEGDVDADIDAGVYALYNNGPNTILAKNNCWVEDGEGTLAEAEDVIFHQVDDPTLGEVIFDPIYCEPLANIVDIDPASVVFYPNPAKNQITFQNQNNFETVTFYNVNGQKVFTQNVTEGTNTINFNLPAGIYFAAFDGQKNQAVKKVVIK
jgi:hypothetical protein